MVEFALYDIFLFRGGMQYRLKPLWRLVQGPRRFGRLPKAELRSSAAALVEVFRQELVLQVQTMEWPMSPDWQKVLG